MSPIAPTPQFNNKTTTAVAPHHHHSPYGAAVIPIAAMSESTRQYYASLPSSRSSRTPSVAGSDEDAASDANTATHATAVSSTSSSRTAPPAAFFSTTTAAAAAQGLATSPSQGPRSFTFLQRSSPVQPFPPQQQRPSFFFATPPPAPTYAKVSHAATIVQGVTEQSDMNAPAAPRLPPALLLARQGAERLADPSFVSAFCPDLQDHRSHPNTSTSSGSRLSSHNNSPNSSATTTAAQRSVAHADLMGKVTFFPYPTTGSPTTAAAWTSSLGEDRAALPCLFLGQVRFEANEREIAWVVQRTSGVTAVHVEIRARGCWLVHVATKEDADLVLAAHRRVLYDNSGIWFAADAAQHDAMAAYLSSENRRSVPRLPRDAVIIEPAVPSASRDFAPRRPHGALRTTTTNAAPAINQQPDPSI